MNEPDAIGTPEGAPVPEVPAPEPASPDLASITLEDVQADPELSLYIASADRVMDALDLLGQAERVGLPPRRARRLQLALTDPTASIATIERFERLLRTWTAARHASRLGL